MLDKYFAQNFIKKISQYMDYKFMVFNTEGIIIAATEKERVGVFHEAAYNMITQGLDKIIVPPEDVKKYLGVKHGIDMTVRYNNEIVGGIGITGIPEEVMGLITMAKITIESMLDYELYREEANRINNEREEFYSLLLRPEYKDTARIHKMARHQLLDPELPRFSILFVFPDPLLDLQNLLSFIKESSHFTPQDIAFVNKSQEIIIFKHVSLSNQELFQRYRHELEQFILPIYERLLKKQIKFQYYIGSMQNKLENYNFSHKHCLWLRDNEKHRAFFYSYINEYIQSQIPAIELHGIFNSISDLMPGSHMKEDFIELISALNACNYNLVDSSRMLHIHKNTLIVHLNKIRELYNINPLQNGDERAFTDYLCHYLTSIMQ